MEHDVLIVGGGIAGMESALTLGDMGYKILLVEKQASIGGKMILLSKVFPTLDCASCISTPKMAATSHHPNIDMRVNTEVEGITKLTDGTFKVKIKRKATFVDPAACTGCGECEKACTVAQPDQFNFDLAARRTAFIPFPQAVPKKAVIERFGSSPCNFTCPAGIKAHGYVSLIRSGLYDEAMDLIMEVTPIVASLGRTCFAPCERECTRGKMEGPLPIRMLKRFAADHYYEKNPHPPYGPPGEKRDKKVAIVGSGPAGLTAAYHLAKNGYEVTIFEAAEEPGGMLRLSIPAYRLPKDVLDRDIENVTALGVEIKTGHRVQSLAKLREDGFDAVFAACGAMQDLKMKIEGDDLSGVEGALTFLMRVSSNEKTDLTGKTVMVVGGGNVAIDAARVALRLGSAKVLIQYRRSRAEMPALDAEIEDAIEEGVDIQYLKAPVRFKGASGKLEAVESVNMKLGEPDKTGRRRPVPIEGSTSTMKVDLCLVAIGQRPDLAGFSEKDGTALTRWNTLEVDSTTLETNIPGVFAGGDVVSGPASVVEAVNSGVRAAEYMRRYLEKEELPGKPMAQPPAVVDRDDVLKRNEGITKLTPAKIKHLPVEERVHNFKEVELPFTEDEARFSASRCMDCGGCSECHQCVHACPANAIHLDMQSQSEELEVGAVVLSTGFQLFDAHLKERYIYGKHPNVITAMQMDRILAPTRPYNGVLRPSDGKKPDNIAYVLCTGSRDHTVGNPLCSRVCCMYSIKQAQLIMGALPLADITIYYMDIRAFGKGYEEFYKQAADMGVYFVKGRVGSIEPADNGNLVVHYEDIEGEGGHKTAEHDLVVLSVGLFANPEAGDLFQGQKLDLDLQAFINEVDEDIDPGRTNIEGVFAAGSASAIRDIPDTILHSGSAAAQAASYLERRRAAK
ncbi:MAG: FAD-dependent oxidoreductase [Deltaproteobacteria bacterium]|nr:FAD-dependent oxidoreductase [Deltaproteobacteria bacterium]